MRKRILGVFGAAFAAAVLLAGQPAAAQPEVILVGTAHDLHFRPEAHYSLVDLKHEMEALHPDAICGEITPEAYRGAMEGFFPVEAAFLSEIAPALHAKFVPADWRIAAGWMLRATRIQSKAEAAREAEIDGRQYRETTGYRGVSLFDYYHSEAFNALSDRKFEDIVGEDTVADIANGGWHERNRRIVENCLDGAPDAHRIVIAFGANHMAQLRRQLALRNIAPQIASRQFTPAGTGEVPTAVVDRWRKNLANLHGVADGSIPASRDDRLKALHANTKRLEQAIAAYGGKAP